MFLEINNFIKFLKSNRENLRARALFLLTTFKLNF